MLNMTQHATMVGVCYTPDERQQMGRSGMAYYYRTVNYVIGCSKSTAGRYIRALSDPQPVTVVPRTGCLPRITQDDISLSETVSMDNRRVEALDILPLLKKAGLVISVSTVRRLAKRLGIKRYVAVVKPFVDKRARNLRIEYAQRHLEDDPDAWRRTIFCDDAILRTNGAVKTWVWRRLLRTGVELKNAQAHTDGRLRGSVKAEANLFPLTCLEVLQNGPAILVNDLSARPSPS